MGEMELSVKLQLANEQFVSALSAAVGDFRTAMDALKTSGVSAGNSIDDAFKNLGIRSGATIKAEVDKIRTSFATLKNSDLGFADKERASLALNTRLRELGRELGTVSSQNRSVQASAAGTAAGLNTLSGSVGDVAHRMLLWAGGITALQQGLSSIIATGSEFEQLGVRMKTVMGGVEQGEKAFAWIKQFAIDTPFQLTEVSQAFIKLKSFGIDPMNGSMQAITDQSAALGGGMETLNGITLALGQAWAKSKLQGQEILQLVERGVPVWDLLSKATGKSTAELVKMSEAGDLGREVIAQLIAEMGKANSGAAADMMDTFAGALSNAKDALAAFFNQIAESGALDYLKTRLQELVAEMDRLKQNGELAARAREMSDAIIAVAKAVEAAARFVVMFREEIATLIALNAASKFTGMLAGFAQTGAAAKKSATEVKGLGNQLLMLPSRLILPIAIVVTGVELYQKVTGWIDNMIRKNRELQEASRKAAYARSDEALNIAAANGHAGMAMDEINKKYFAGSDQSAMATGKIIGDFRKLTVEAKGTGQALDEMVKKVNFSDQGSIDKMLASMDTLKRSGLVTGNEIRDSIGGALAKLSTKDFIEFQNASVRSFDGSVEGARKLGIALDASLATGFKKLGGDIDKFRTGMDQATKDAIANFDLMSENAQASGREIGEAFNLALKTADTRKEAEALGLSLKQAAKDGKISGKDLEDAQSRLQAKLNETAGQIDGALGDAFKRLGIKSAEAMKAAAVQMVQDFNDIKNSGQASAEGIDAAYQKIKSSVTASIQAMTTASREALQATKDHTSAVQAGADAIKAQGTAMTASANAQKADAEYAKASTEAMQSGSAAAREKADALGLAAQASHSAADAAWADARASQAAAEAAKAEEAAKKAMAAAAANPNEWTQQAAVAAQNFANETARGAEEAKQAAINAQAVAAEMSAAASAASAMANGLEESARAGAHYLSNAAVDQGYFSAVGAAANDAWREATSAVQGYADKAREAGDGTADSIERAMNGIMAGAAGTGEKAIGAMRGLRRELEQREELNAWVEGFKEFQESARGAAKSAEDAVRGFVSSSRSIHEELLTAQGREDEAAASRYASRKAELELSYRQLQTQIMIAEVQAKAAGIDTAELSQAKSDAAAAFNQAKNDLAQLEKIDAERRKNEKQDAANDAASAAEKAAAEKAAAEKAAAEKAAAEKSAAEKSAAEKSAADAAEKSAAEKAAADAAARSFLDKVVNPPSYSTAYEAAPVARIATDVASVPVQSAASSGSSTVTIRFAAPSGSSVSGAFSQGDAGKMLAILKQAGARTL